MLPKRLHTYAFSLVMSLFMSGVMSLVLLSVEYQSFSLVMLLWPKAWGISLIVAFPVSLFVIPVTQRLVSKIITDR